MKDMGQVQDVYIIKEVTKPDNISQTEVKF